MLRAANTFAPVTIPVRISHYEKVHNPSRLQQSPTRERGTIRVTGSLPHMGKKAQQVKAVFTEERKVARDAGFVYSGEEGVGEREGERVGAEKETDPGFKNCYAT